MKLPMYMLATTAQKSCGCSLISSGPGVTPWISRAPRRMAVTGPNGMPSANRGMKADCVAELLAVSGPATPSIAPLPNSSGCFESRFSTM